jgi:futalosine hydrolase
MPKELLIITAVEAEARAIGEVGGALVIAGGIGRTNAAATTTEQILKYKGRAPFDAVISAGVAGALPGSNLKIGDAIVASSCIYAEEGIVTATGFAGIDGIGFALGDFAGNTVPVDEELLDALAGVFAIGPIATVATCSGTDAAAMEVARRTGAIAEAMEGAAVVHAARRLHVPAIELRAISNTTGDRSGQSWDLDAAFASLAAAVRHVRNLLT